MEGGEVDMKWLGFSEYALNICQNKNCFDCKDALYVCKARMEIAFGIVKMISIAEKR